MQEGEIEDIKPLLPPERRVCGVRLNQRGMPYTLVYDKVVSRHIDPIGHPIANGQE